MKFNEKLINLRKKQGLSQEELGYKLNVTRQTVSKWELGQTKPEMDKLSELSNIFGVSVDSLLDETDDNKQEDAKVVKEEKTNKNDKTVIIIIGVIVAIVVVVIAICKIISGTRLANKLFGEVYSDYTNTAKKVVNGFVDMVEEEKQRQAEEDKNMLKDFQKTKNEMENQMKDYTETFQNSLGEIDNKDSNTKRLEMYIGTQNGMFVRTVINLIVTNNKKHPEDVIKVTYNEKNVTDNKSLQELESKIKTNKQYSISYEYDGEYISQADILELN